MSKVELMAKLRELELLHDLVAQMPADAEVRINNYSTYLLKAVD